MTYLVTDIQEVPYKEFYYLFINNQMFTTIEKKYLIDKNQLLNSKITKEELKELIKKTQDKCIKQAYKLLGYSAMSSNMMSDKLKFRGFEGYVVKKCIQKLEKEKYLDDYQYALDILDRKSADSIASLEHYLRLKKVKEDIISQVLSKYNLDMDRLERKFMSYVSNKDMTDFKIKQKVIAKYMRAGYNYSNIEELIKKWYAKNGN